VYTTTTTAESLQREKRERKKNFGKRMDDWNISNSSRLSSEKREPRLQ
jgi:hypothetical protein